MGNDLCLIKFLQSGELTNSFRQFVSMHESYTPPFRTSKTSTRVSGGIKVRTFRERLSAFHGHQQPEPGGFLQVRRFRILFAGDLERDGWLALLDQPAFCAELSGTNVLVASHHGRDNGSCKEAFNRFTPNVVVNPDKSVIYDTQETVPDYRDIVSVDGVNVRTTMKRRHVLTTRRDGHITFTVQSDGVWFIDTECRGECRSST